MIAPMMKIWLVLLEKDKAVSLKALRRLGLVHLEALAGKGEEFEALSRHLAAVEAAIGLLSSKKAPAEAGETTGLIAASAGNSSAALHEKGLEIANRSASLSEALRSSHEESQRLTKELERIADWGDFEPGIAREIDDRGLGLAFYECPLSSLKALPADLNFVRLAAPKGRARLVFIGKPAGPLSADFVEFQLPELSPAALRAGIASAKEAARAAESELSLLAAKLPILKATQSLLSQELALEQVRSGMAAEEKLAYLSGYIPEKELDALRKSATAHSWGLLVLEPSPEELPPSKVENGPLVRIVQPIFDFLGTTPGYREYDISGWFLIFFCLFFAMIFGDGGYGAIMMAMGGGLAVKAKLGGKKVPDFVRLLLLLAGSTMFYGAITGTWFAIPIPKLPAFLRALMIPFVAGDNPASTENIKILCFIVGALQVSLAHVKNIIRDFPNPKFLAQLGWLSAVLGLYFLVLNLVLDAVKYPVPGFALYMIGAGFLLVFVFGNWDGKLGKSLLGGLGGLLTQFLGTVSALADIISYIRLFAVGLAGLAIAQTFNTMGGGMMKSLLGTVMGLVILVFGHGLNLMMSTLSVVVHGVRLNMLEFSGHLGMEWSGYKYDPFRVGVEEDNVN